MKVQHAYKSCTKNKSNVKLLTASEKIGSSDSAIITWELCDRKRDSIQFSRVEHHSLAICSLPKFCLVLYTASYSWGQWNGKVYYSVFNCITMISSRNFPYCSLSWKTTCINTRSTKVFSLDNIFFSWHVFCLFFKKRNKFLCVTLCCHSQGQPGGKWGL